jgi:hypothetical protein
MMLVPLRHQPLAHPMQRLQIQLLRGLGRHELHRRAAARLRQLLRVIEVVLLSLAIGGHIWPGSTWHRDQAMQVCGSGDVRRRKLPCRSDKAYIGEPHFHLATQPLLLQHDGAPRIVAHDVERVLADIDADRGIGCLRHGVLLVFGAPCQLRRLAGQEARPDRPISGHGIYCACFVFALPDRTPECEQNRHQDHNNSRGQDQPVGKQAAHLESPYTKL